MYAVAAPNSWVGRGGRLAQGAQFQARRLSDFFPVQFGCGVVSPSFPEAFEPSLPSAERFDRVVEPTGVPGGWRQWLLNGEENIS